MRRIAVLVMCLLLCLMTVTGCGQKGVQEQPPAQTEAPDAQTAPAAAETDPPENAPAETEPRLDVMVVSTPYGKIYYQEQWAEFMKVEQFSEGDALNVRFVAEINGIDYPLFVLIVGAAEQDAVAQLTDADGVQRNVQVHMEETGDHAGLSVEEQNRLCAMQEEINFVIENLK